MHGFLNPAHKTEMQYPSVHYEMEEIVRIWKFRRKIVDMWNDMKLCDIYSCATESSLVDLFKMEVCSYVAGFLFTKRLLH